MHPILFTIPIFGGLRIYTYGVLVATAFALGILWTVHEARLAGINREKILDLAFNIVVSALIGSRILYILVEWRRYLHHPLEIFKIWEGGLIFFGGLIAAILTSFYYLKKQKLPFFKVADLYMPGVAIGHAIGRLGCLASGCCHGREASGISWAITFPDLPYSLAPIGIPLYPVQLMEATAEASIFLLLVLLRRGKKFDGQIFATYLAVYGILRIILEHFRGNLSRAFIIPPWLSASQLISLFLILIAVVSYLKLKRKGIS